MAHNELKEYTEQAIEAADMNVTLPPIVWLPPKLRGKQVRVFEDAVTKTLPTVRENLVRITADVDPIGLLIAIANGMPLSKFVIGDDGEVQITAVYPDMKTRFAAIKCLADRVHPRMSVQGTINPEKPSDKGRLAALIENAERDAG